MKQKLRVKYPLIAVLLVAVALCLLALPYSNVSADPPEPTPSPAMDIKTRLQPYQTPGIEASPPDGQLFEEAPFSSEVEEPPIGALAQRTIYCSGDATVLQGYPSMNFGNTADMWAGYDVCYEPNGKIARSLIKCSMTSLPSNATITGAKLRVYLITSCDSAGTSRTIRTYRITSNWSESSVTWNNKPGYGSAYGSRSIVHGDWGWYEFDVTGLVKAWHNGTYTNQGIMLRGPEVLGWRGFSTREGPYQPRLVVEYDVNNPPTLSPIPDRHLEANTCLDNAIDLWAYASDAASPDSELDFTIDNTPNTNAGVSIVSNRYVRICPTTDWTGQTDVTIRVTDPGGLSDTDTFRVIVTASNTPPVLAPLPDQTIEVNACLDNVIDLWAYASDAESPDSELDFTIDNTPNTNAGISIVSNRYVRICPVTDWTGQTDVTIKVSDGDLSDTDTFSVTVSDTETFVYLPIILNNAGSSSPPIGPPSAPVLDSIDNSDGNGSYTVSWSSVTGATGYVLQEDDNASFTSPSTAYSGASTSKMITGKSAGTYYYRVQATNSSGSSPWSNVVSVQVAQQGVVPEPGTWYCYPGSLTIRFTVSSDSSSVSNGRITASCGSKSIAGPTSIENGKFTLSHSDGLTFIGATFDKADRAQGSFAFWVSSSCWAIGTMTCSH